jgi:hypothetical protein
MPCRKCGSDYLTESGSEINTQPLGSSDLDKQGVLLFPKLLVCLECGFTEFTLSESDLLLLSKCVKQ